MSSGNEMYDWFMSSVSGSVNNTSYQANYMMPMLRVNRGTTYGTQNSTSVSVSTSETTYLESPYTIPDMSSWATNPVGCIYINRDNMQIPEGSRLILSTLSGRITFRALNSTGSSTTWTYARPDNINVWVANGSGASNKRLCTYDRDSNAYIVPINCRYIYITMRLYGTPRGTNVMVEIPYEVHVYLDLEGTYTQQIIDNQTQNTDRVMNTDGSSGVVSGVQGQGQQIVNRLGFVSQTASFVSSTVGIFANGDASSTVNFPGITWDSQTIVASQDVNILGWLGSNVESAVKGFCTMLCFLAWIAGLRGFYHKIFLGEVEVEVMEE